MSRTKILLVVLVAGALVTMGAGCTKQEVKNNDEELGVNYQWLSPNTNEELNTNGSEVSGNLNNTNAEADANWKTWENKKYGYTLKYPVAWNPTQFDESVFNATSGDTQSLTISMPPLGFGYPEKDATVSNITLNGNIPAKRMDWTDGYVVVTFIHNGVEGMLNYQYDKNAAETGLQTFSDILARFSFAE